MRRPRITQSVIEGILEATSPALAGDLDEGDYKDAEHIHRAGDWAAGMKLWMKYKGTWREDEND